MTDQYNLENGQCQQHQKKKTSTTSDNDPSIQFKWKIRYLLIISVLLWCYSYFKLCLLNKQYTFTTYADIGDPIYMCPFCQAYMWYE